MSSSIKMSFLIFKVTIYTSDCKLYVFFFFLPISGTSYIFSYVFYVNI